MAWHMQTKQYTLVAYPDIREKQTLTKMLDAALLPLTVV
jgi:hypothetical protein